MKQKQMLFFAVVVLLLVLGASACQEKHADDPWQYYGETTTRPAATPATPALP